MTILHKDYLLLSKHHNIIHNIIREFRNIQLSKIYASIIVKLMKWLGCIIEKMNNIPKYNTTRNIIIVFTVSSTQRPMLSFYRKTDKASQACWHLLSGKLKGAVLTMSFLGQQKRLCEYQESIWSHQLICQKYETVLIRLTWRVQWFLHGI
jgi:hypothetical protein